MSVPVASAVVGLMFKACVVVAGAALAHAVLVPGLRALTGRTRARRSTLDRLERQADEQPAVRIVVVDAGGRRAIEPVRLAGSRGLDGGTSIECVHDDGHSTWIDSAAIVAIEELAPGDPR